MKPLSLDELSGLVDGATIMSPSSSQPAAKSLSLDELDSMVPKAPQKIEQPLSKGTPYDQALFLRTESTGANAIVRGVLGKGASYAAALGNQEVAANLNSTIQNYFPAEAPNFNENTGTFAYESVITNTPDLALSLGLAAIPVVGIPLAIGEAFFSQYGESRMAIQEGTGKDDSVAALVPAAINTALDMAVPMMVARKLGLLGPLQKEVVRTRGEMAKYLGKETLQTAGIEGATEAVQWASNLATVRFLNDENVLKGLTEAEQQEALNNFFGGVFGGGGFGLGAAGYTLYKQGKTDEALQKEIDDIDELLNRIREEVPAPTAVPTAVPAPKSPETAPESQPAPPAPIPTPDPASAPVIVPTETGTRIEVLGIVHSVANEIKSLPEKLKSTAVSSLEARRDTLMKLKGQLDSELQMKALGAPDKEGFDFAFADDLENTNYPLSYFSVSRNAKKYVPSTEGMISSIPDAKVPQAEPFAVYSQNPMLVKELEQSGYIAREILNKLGFGHMKLAVEGVPPVGGNMVNYGSAGMTGDMIIIKLNPQARAVNEGKADNTLYHELGHVIADLLVHDVSKGNVKERPEADALRAAYDTYIKSITNAKKEDRIDVGGDGVPLHTSGLNPSLGSAVELQIQYQTSFEEWLAEGFRQALLNRIADGTLNFEKVAPTIFKRIKDAMVTVYKTYRKYVGSKESGIQTFQAFLDRALISQEIREINAKLENKTANKTKKQGNEKAEKIKDKDKAPQSLLDELKRVAEKNNAQLELDGLSWDELSKVYKQITEKFQSWLDDLSPEFQVAMDKYATRNAKQQEHTDHVTETLNKVGFKKQALRLQQMKEINMGILGDSAIGNFFRSTLTPIQVAEQANNRGYAFGNLYMAVIQKWQMKKTTIVEAADRTAKLWMQNGKESRDRISKALYIISTKSDELKRRLTETELKIIFDQLKMTDHDIEAWRAVDQSFQDVLSGIWANTVLDIARTYNPEPRDREAAKTFRDAFLAAQSQTERNTLVEQYTKKPLVDANLNLNPMMEAIDKAQKAHSRMQSKNYFPRSRLGEYVVRVKALAKGAEFDGAVAQSANETLAFYAFDTEREQREFLESLGKVDPNVKVIGHKLDSEVYSAMGMPAGMIEQIIRTFDQDPNTKLNPLQRELLNDIALERAPGRRFLRHMTKRRGIAGYSEDALRVYANYMGMASNHTARSEFAPEAASVIADMQRNIMGQGGNVILANDLNVLKDYFARHLDYLMKADNDWATLRAVGFLWYLGFNVKSALVNFMQTPMVTLPVLAKDVTTSKAAGRIATSMKDLVKHWKGKSPLSPSELSMLDHMIKANLIDESLVSELAGLGEADALARFIPGLSGQNILTKVSWAGGAMFRVGEKFNRYVAALSAYRIAERDLNMKPEDAIQYAVTAIQSSQFEYAKFNRPEFMRGKKSVVFLFWQYIQHASYLFFGGKGARVAKRMWLMTLFLAGLEGLPFAQLLTNAIDFTGTAVRDVFGVSDPKVEINKMIRELISNIYDRPDDIMKGFSYHYGLGPFHLLNYMGVPVPNVTTEGSLGFGNPMPWFDSILDPSVSDMDKALGQTAAAILGPIGGMALGVVEAVGYSKEEDNWKRWEKTLPVFMKNASQGVRWAVRGEETTSNGMQVTAFETPEQRAEIALKTLGFTPTRVDQTRRQMRAAQQGLLYLQARKQMLLDDLWHAKQTNDREYLADVKQSIREYNDQVRSDGLAKFVITADTMINSLSERNKARALSEKGLAADQRQEILRRQMEKLIPITGE